MSNTWSFSTYIQVPTSCTWHWTVSLPAFRPWLLLTLTWRPAALPTQRWYLGLAHHWNKRHLLSICTCKDVICCTYSMYIQMCVYICAYDYILYGNHMYLYLVCTYACIVYVVCIYIYTHISCGPQFERILNFIPSMRIDNQQDMSTL